MRAKPAKIPDLLTVVRRAVESGEYFDTYHSSLRRTTRGITRSEIEFVLKNGWHEKTKDNYEARCGTWNYAQFLSLRDIAHTENTEDFEHPLAAEEWAFYPRSRGLAAPHVKLSGRGLSY